MDVFQRVDTVTFERLCANACIEHETILLAIRKESRRGRMCVVGEDGRLGRETVKGLDDMLLHSPISVKLENMWGSQATMPRGMAWRGGDEFTSEQHGLHKCCLHSLQNMAPFLLKHRSHWGGRSAGSLPSSARAWPSIVEGKERSILLAWRGEFW